MKTDDLRAVLRDLYDALESCETVMMIVQPRSHTREYLACLDQARAALARARSTGAVP